MKHLLLFIITLVLHQNILAQEEVSLLGDNFSLENALELFKESASLEDFEKSLNQENNEANNLDLNEDGETDFLMVTDEYESDVHAIIISALISKDETQDVAVIEIEKTGNDEAVLQIVGDEDLYGENNIVEPYEETTTLKGSGPYTPDLYPRITVNVWLWPSVRGVYRPGYVTYRSTWRWGYYPRWWTPWRPLAWTVWRPIRVRHTPRYRVTRVHRVTAAHRVYVPKRRVSKTVTVKRNVKVTKNKTVVRKTQKTNSTTKKVNQKTKKANQKTKKANQKTKKANQKTKKANQKTKKANQKTKKVNQKSKKVKKTKVVKKKKN